jgi:hypothetical protein
MFNETSPCGVMVRQEIFYLHFCDRAMIMELSRYLCLKSAVYQFDRLVQLGFNPLLVDSENGLVMILDTHAYVTSKLEFS